MQSLNLNIGTYEVQVSNAGFQTVVHGGITLTIGGEPVVDFQLPVGQAQQTVNVEGQVSTVETQSTAIGSLVEGTQMRELPLNGRNYTQLVALEPGVTQIVAGAPASGSSFAGNGLKYTISGARPNNNSWLLDGQDLLGWWRNCTLQALAVWELRWEWKRSPSFRSADQHVQHPIPGVMAP